MTPGVRAEWHLADLTDDQDPFGNVTYTAGLKIDLSAPVEELEAVLSGLLRREARLDRVGVQCEHKDGGQDCRDCPHATLDPQNPQSTLCRVGKDQFTVADVVQARYRQAKAERESEGVSALGELPDDIAELLTAVGL